MDLPTAKHFHKLRAAVIHNLATAQIPGAYDRHLLRCQGEIPDSQILPHPLPVNRLGDNGHSTLHIPPEHNLGYAFAVSGFPIEVSHFPPGTSKWNKIEHRLFSQITRNWQGKPLISLEVIVNLIAATTASTGLKVKCGLDEAVYETGIKVSDEDFSTIKLVPNDFCSHLNYTIFQH